MNDIEKKSTSEEDKAQLKENKHIERQKKIKKAVDERVANATEERGVLVVITGNFKLFF